LAKARKLKGSENLRKDPFRTDQCDVCLEQTSRDTLRIAECRDAWVAQMALCWISNWRDHWTRRWMATDTCSSGSRGGAASYSLCRVDQRAEEMRVVKEALTMLERQLGDKVCVIRSDGGTEFDNGEAMMWCRSTGIQHYTLSRHTPELNGAAKGWYTHS
jgi:hypothetical protein